ncbi:MAG TPA: ATP-binding protein [Solirubrobacteraceae bacterium]|nr:ATP-binding protein [Solirubrobacteraceae bacterium]
MSALLLAGWALAALACVAALSALRERRCRMEQVARACHELRGPITAVRLGLELSARTNELPPERLRALDSELGRASLALDDLAAARAGGRRATRGRSPGWRWPVQQSWFAPRPQSLDRVWLRPLVHDAIAAAAGRADAAGASVTGGWRGPDAAVWGDRLRLAQALGNLVANAVEHGGGEVRVHGELRAGGARITVDDDGPGLPAPVAELARRPRAGRGARGRGLAIAASIAHAHAGSVTAAPVARGGRVVLMLPGARRGATGERRRSGED